MPRWRVDYLGKKDSHLGTVEAADEREAVAKAAEMFHIRPTRRFKLLVELVEGSSRWEMTSAHRAPYYPARPKTGRRVWTRRKSS
jgi:hypothetical protein